MHVSKYLQLEMTKTKKGLMRIWRLKLANDIDICVVSETALRDGPLENLGGGGGQAKYQKKYSNTGKFK